MIEPLEPASVRRRDPFVGAVLGYFATLGARMDGDLSTHGYLAGGIAVRCFADRRTTDDIDVFFQGARVLVPPNTTVLVRLDGRDHGLTFDHQYTPTFGLLHPDFEARAVPLLGGGGARFRLSVLHPVDLALTKVARLEDHDRGDIVELAATGTFDGAALRELGEEALGYMVGNLSFARSNLRDAVGLVDRAVQGRPRPR